MAGPAARRGFHLTLAVCDCGELAEALSSNEQLDSARVTAWWCFNRHPSQLRFFWFKLLQTMQIHYSIVPGTGVRWNLWFVGITFHLRDLGAA